MKPKRKILIIVRGCSSSGKSSFAAMLCNLNGNCGARLEADDYFMLDGKYEFDAALLSYAHQWCKDQCELYMKNELELIIVSNTSTRLKEYQPYLDLAAKYSYEHFVVTMNKHHNGENKHNVPSEVILKQAARFEHKLI